MSENLHEGVTQTGAKIKIKWLTGELGDTGWRQGWYSATVHKYDRESDTITITYTSEPGVLYHEELSPLVENKIKVLHAPV